MTPTEKIRAFYSDAAAFRDELSAHLVNGWVFGTPGFFAMGRAVDLRGPRECVLNPWFSFPGEDCNAWLVWAFAGSSQEILKHVPYPLEYVAWQRRGGGLRVHEFKRCIQLITRQTR